MDPEQDTEITLGTAKLLSLFFGLVIICAVFFALGYTLGRKTDAGIIASSAAAPANFIQRPQARRLGISSTRSADDLLQSRRAERRESATDPGFL